MLEALQYRYDQRTGTPTSFVWLIATPGSWSITTPGSDLEGRCFRSVIDLPEMSYHTSNTKSQSTPPIPRPLPRPKSVEPEIPTSRGGDELVALELRGIEAVLAKASGIIALIPDVSCAVGDVRIGKESVGMAY